MNEFILEMEGITKDFPGNRALENVSLKLRRDEVHGLCGENGAGKSTLMKIMSGIYPYGTFEGKITLKGDKLRLHNPKESEQKGIAIIHQEFALVEEMSVTENIFLGSEIARLGRIKEDEMVCRTKDLLNHFNLDINPTTRVKELGVGYKQLVEIAKALSKNPEILILDEPTASLTDVEIELLFDIIKLLKSKGVTCVYISHKINEIMTISDTVTVLRDGKVIGCNKTSDCDEDKIISMMVGRDFSNLYPKEEHDVGEIVMEVKEFSVYRKRDGRKVVDNVSFNLREGEILGIAGLMGAGRTELVSSIYSSYGYNATGTVVINGKEFKKRSSTNSLKNGLAMVPEDRKNNGIIPINSVKKNLTLANLKKYKGFFNSINEAAEVNDVKGIIEKLQIKTTSIETKLNSLSGGNQQKVVIGKNLLAEPKILIVDEPTRGIDVGAKWEIYKLIFSLVKTGISVIMISSELPEIIALSDRILVMNEGKLKGELDNNNVNEEMIMKCALGGKS